MKYADEVIELLSTYPHRTFRVRTIVNYINPKFSANEKRSASRQVRRVLEGLVEVGSINVKSREKLGAGAEYRWGIASNVMLYPD